LLESWKPFLNAVMKAFLLRVLAQSPSNRERLVLAEYRASGKDSSRNTDHAEKIKLHFMVLSYRFDTLT
jgi:hypothetical protein